MFQMDILFYYFQNLVKSGLTADFMLYVISLCYYSCPLASFSHRFFFLGREAIYPNASLRLMVS